MQNLNEQQAPEQIVIAGKVYNKDPEVIYFPDEKKLQEQVTLLREKFSQNDSPEPVAPVLK